MKTQLKTIAYHSTVGLNASVPGYAMPKLVRIAHNKLENGSWILCVESGHSLSMLKKCGTKCLTDDEIQPLFSDDNINEFRNLANLFGIEV